MRRQQKLQYASAVKLLQPSQIQPNSMHVSCLPSMGEMSRARLIDCRNSVGMTVRPLSITPEGGGGQTGGCQREQAHQHRLDDNDDDAWATQL